MTVKTNMEEQAELRVEPWMRGLLLLAGAYNLGWGFFIYHFPNSFYRWVSQTEQAAPSVIEWQGLGVLLFGAVYIALAIYPATLWYLLAVGVASKVVGAAWFYWIVLDGMATRQFLFHLIMNDLVWVVPFGIILARAFQVNQRKHHQVT